MHVNNLLTFLAFVSNVSLQFVERHLQLIQLLVFSARVPPDTAQDDDEYEHKQYEYADTDDNRYYDYYHTRLLIFKSDVTDCCHLIT